MQKLDQFQQFLDAHPSNGLPPNSASGSTSNSVVNGTMTNTTEEDVLQWLLNLSNQMSQTETIDLLLMTVVTEVQRYFQLDRVLVYQFHNENNGAVLAEAIVSGFTPTINEALPAIAFGAAHSTLYQQQQMIAIENGAKYLTPHQRQLLDRFQVASSLSLPVLLRGGVWGLLVAQRCAILRPWSETEKLVLHQVRTELQLHLQPLALHAQQRRQVKVEDAFAQILERTQPSSDTNTALANLCQELRLFYRADRAVVYRFHSDWSGEFVAESVAAGWISVIQEQEIDPSLRSADIINHDRCTTKRMGSPPQPNDNIKILKDTQGGSYVKRMDVKQVNDISKAGFSACYLDTLEKYQAKAYLIAPIYEGNELWGLLAIYQNTAPRQWQEQEAALLLVLGERLSMMLTQLKYLARLQEKTDQLQIQSQQLTESVEQGVAHNKLISRIGLALVQEKYSPDSLLDFVVRELRKQLKSDRIAVYRFYPDWGGEFVAESVAEGWVRLVTPEMNTIWEDSYLQETQGGRYRNNETFAVDDIYQAGHAECHIEVLEQFEVKAYAIAPIFQGKKLWGLIGAYQNSHSRHWNELDVNLLSQVGVQIGLALQQGEYLEQLQQRSEQLSKVAEQERLITEVVNRIRRSLDMQQAFKTTTREIRNFLKADRVAIFKFDPDGRDGRTVAEDVNSAYTAALSVKVTDHCFSENFGRKYKQGWVSTIPDIYQAGLADCYIEVLSQFQVRANLVVPLLKGEELWGLFSIHQCSGPREWQDSEIEFAKRIAAQLNVAIQQGEYLEQVQQKSEQLAKVAEQEQLVTKIVDRIRQSLDTQQAFKTTAREIRNFLNADRVAIFKFDPGGRDGKTVAEDVRSAYTAALSVKVTDHCFTENFGRKYKQGWVSKVSDIYEAGLADCYIEVLSQFQVRANLVVPLLKGEELWGLFCIHQCSGPREWQDSEIDFAKRIAAQLNVAIQQGEYLEQLQQKTEQLATAAQREKMAKEQLQQEVMQLLSAVRPALDGDLTVRAPMTEDEVGTIADAYNNTLGSLRQIVTQMQIASQQVAQTSQISESSIASLTNQAKHQFQTLSQTLERVQLVASSTEAVEASAQQVEVAVQQANQIVLAGDAAMDRTVDEMQNIRETVAETNKRLKRLSESSQKISKVVSLISNFTTQTQLLALNASIEATRAGEYGRGFVVVADEVRSLARQSANAATEIEQLVQEIQANTAEVSTAMETGIQQVASGTTVVSEARQNLNAIVAATDQISQLVASITGATQEQTQQFKSMKLTVAEVAEIAQKTSKDSVEISQSFKELLAMSQDLQVQANQFKVK
ncbi:GAF domain-containing protein [Leptolyngbya sp. FACHB-671]|uniref:GAF domain-containing protein n=1 Tax=Leptolyngbya sp. FACHB-671 TaxID=2692812 RepID=UPI00168597A7|nr:GAF domain-containing protein [Leptolyngbya sp. FACHB-671]